MKSKHAGLLAPQYRDEDVAREHIEKQRWPEGPECPHCGLVNEATKLEPRNGSKTGVRKGVWNCKGCRKQFTVTVDSIFADSHIPLHKWLLAPNGTGLLYVRRSKIKGLWPLMAAPTNRDDDIRKYEEIGTHPAANYLAIGEALTFHQGIGGKRKEKRLVFLRDYWADRLKRHDRIKLHTSQKPGFACGIANVFVEGIDTAKLNQWLWDKHRILTVGIKHAEFTGLRVSPSVYTSLEELDRFGDAIEHVLKHGL